MTLTIDNNTNITKYSSNINKAMAYAINHTTAKAKTAGNSAMRSVWNIKLGDLTKYETLIDATSTKVYAVFKLKSKAISLYYFSAKQTKTGVRYKLKVKEGSKVKRHAFIATMPNGGIGVFNRKTSKRLPIVKNYSITPTTMFSKDGEEAFTQVINRDLSARFNYEIGRLTK